MSFVPAFSFVDELRSRGLLHDIMPGTEELLNSESVSGYIGFDPTADSLHIGNLVPITLLMHFQRAGHKPYVLVGGATGLVGDPSGKKEERKLLDEELILNNLRAQKSQLEKFLDFENGSNKAVMVNNHDWFKDFSFLGFIRDVGKHITINYMMSKDSVKNRLESGGLSFTEFTYQLVQGYDFYHLHAHHQVKLQMGGSDQWGNITTGTELIRRMSGGEAYALTAPLVTKSDGSKFGKSEGGNIWLDRNKTSPYKFYQFWLNVADEDAEKFIKIYSLKPINEINEMIESHKGNEHLRSLQKALAEELTQRIHSVQDLEMAQKTTNVFFGNGDEASLRALSEKELEAGVEGLETFEIEMERLNQGIPILDILAVDTSIFPSKSEARKILQGNGLSLNKTKFNDANGIVNSHLLMHGRYLIVQKGKKSYYVIKAI